MASTADVHAGDHGHHKPGHDYHLVDPSPWPIIGATGALLLTGGTVMWMHGHGLGEWLMLLGFITIIFVMFRWWRDVLSESYKGDHTKVVAHGLRVGMGLFITSEVLFFFAFFWAFFWAALHPPMLVATSWPPEGIEPIPAFDIPFLNTMILLLSGATVTWAHHAIKEGDQRTGFKALAITVALGIIFTSLQAYEYFHAFHEGLTLRSGVFGSTFFMATGFHGFHVIVGTTFLLVCTIRAWNMTFKPEKHVGFEAAAWYWHFVDVVWLFLFVCIYWWGGSLNFSTNPV